MQRLWPLIQAVSSPKAVKPATSNQGLSAELSNRPGGRFVILRSLTLVVSIVLLSLCASVESSNAGQLLQSNMERWCRPAAPTTYSIQNWRQPKSCSNDCFVWRLTCSNGKAVTLQSQIHPGTTEVQWMFFKWAPWSFLLYMLPIVAYIWFALIGAQMLLPSLAFNTLFLGYAAYAAWCWHASVTGNPWGAWVGLERAIFLNPYIYGGAVAVFLIFNLPAVVRALEHFFYRHSMATGTAPALWPGHPSYATTMQAALMPHLHEFIDPHETVAHYRRQTEQAQALKDKLDADVALAEALIRRERMRRHLTDQSQ